MMKIEYIFNNIKNKTTVSTSSIFSQYSTLIPRAIRQGKMIEIIKKEVKISLFANDMNLFMGLRKTLRKVAVYKTNSKIEEPSCIPIANTQRAKHSGRQSQAQLSKLYLGINLSKGAKDLSMEDLRALKKTERKTLEDSASHAKALGELVL